MQDGTLSIQKSNVELGFGSPNALEKTIIQAWETIELSSMPDVSSELYTDDDSAAMAKYETTTLQNQFKD